MCSNHHTLYERHNQDTFLEIWVISAPGQIFSPKRLSTQGFVSHSFLKDAWDPNVNQMPYSHENQYNCFLQYQPQPICNYWPKFWKVSKLGKIVTNPKNLDITFSSNSMCCIELQQEQLLVPSFFFNLHFLCKFLLASFQNDWNDLLDMAWSMAC